MSFLDIKLARTLHRNWKLRLKSYLKGGKTLDEFQALSHEDCEFGKWLYREGMFKYGKVREMSQAEQIHVKLHETLRELTAKAKEGETFDLQEELNKIEFLSDRLMSLLSIVEEKAKKGETAG